MNSVELRVYDTELTPLGIVDEVTSLLWTPTYWDEGTVGDIKLLVPMTENNKALLKKGNIIVKHDGTADYTDETGSWRRATQIKYRHITKDVEGAEQIEIQGCFLKKWLSKRVIVNQIVATATKQTIINRIVKENHGSQAAVKRQLPRFVFLEQDNLGGNATDFSHEAFIDAGKEVYNQALAGKLGYDILANENTKKYGFYLFKGKDLTSTNNDGNTPSIFSRDFDNVNEQEYTESDEGYKNVIYVAGASDDSGVIPVVEVDQGGSGLERDEVYSDSSSIARKYKDDQEVEITLTDTQYEALLEAAGTSTLEEYGETVAFTATINISSNLKYRQDFNLGDRVTCIEKNWGIRIDVRITAVCETYQNGTKEIEATLGDSLPTLIQQIRKVR